MCRGINGRSTLLGLPLLTDGPEPFLLVVYGGRVACGSLLTRKPDPTFDIRLDSPSWTTVIQSNEMPDLFPHRPLLPPTRLR